MAYSPNPSPYDRGTRPGYQPYDRGYGPVPREHPDGTTVLVLGILGLVVCGLCAPFAWSKGNTALAEIDRYPAAYTNRGTVQAGRVCGIVGTWLMVAGIVIYALIAIAAAGASS